MLFSLRRTDNKVDHSKVNKFSARLCKNNQIINDSRFFVDETQSQHIGSNNHKMSCNAALHTRVDDACPHLYGLKSTEP